MSDSNQDVAGEIAPLLVHSAAKGPRGSKSQFVILKRGQNIKHRPYAFTEQGIAMFSSGEGPADE